MNSRRLMVVLWSGTPLTTSSNVSCVVQYNIFEPLMTGLGQSRRTRPRQIRGMSALVRSGQMADVSIRPPRASANCGRHQRKVYQYGALACINRANRSQICPLCLQWREQQPGEKRQPRRDQR